MFRKHTASFSCEALDVLGNNMKMWRAMRTVAGEQWFPEFSAFLICEANLQMVTGQGSCWPGRPRDNLSHRANIPPQETKGETKAQQGYQSEEATGRSRRADPGRENTPEQSCLERSFIYSHWAPPMWLTLIQASEKAWWETGNYGC